MTALLGEVVTWDIRGPQIAFSDVQEALRNAGLDPEAATDLSPRSAFGRACKDLKENRQIDKLEFDRKGHAKFQFTTKKKSPDGLLDFDYECLVTLNCETGDIACPENAELEKQAKDLIAFALQTRNAQDVTRLVQRLFQQHADLYPINPRKGVAYFVPDRHRDFTTKVETFLKAIGGDLPRFPVPSGTTEGNANVKAAVQSGLSSLLGELNTAVAEWDETTRKATMEKAAERYQAIAYKVDAYAEYLGSEQDRLKDEIKKAKAELAKKITALTPAETVQAA